MWKKYTILRILSVFCTLFFLCFIPASKQTDVSAETGVPAKGECVIEVNSRRVLFESRGDIRLPMASTTKILTCITVLETCSDLNEKVVIPTEAVGVEGSSVYLKAGDIYTVEELLYGLMLRSGNDCATALALHCCKTIPAFAAKMNETAQKAGALCGNFVNPHGLPSRNHYTTARDLGLITCYAMQNETFKTIVSTKYYPPRQWHNKNKTLSLIEGGVGVKTGYTKEAGRCLVSAAERKGMTLVCVVLNCPTTYERSATLLDDAFAAYTNTKVLDKDEVLSFENTKGIARKDYYYPLLDAEKEWLEIRTTPPLFRKNKEIVAQFEIYLSKRLLFSGNLYKL